MNKSKFIRLASHNRVGLMVLIYLLYAIILDYALWLVARVFYYEGFTYGSDVSKSVFSYGLITILTYITLRFINNKIFKLFSVGIFCMLVEPGIVYFMRNDLEFWHVLLLSGAYIWLILSYALIHKIEFKLDYGHNSTIFYGIISLITIMTYGLATYYLGYKFNLDFIRVYEIRDHFLKSSPFPLGYLVMWQGNIINPLLFYYALEKNRYLLAGVIAISQFYLFSVTGLKVFFFSFIFSYGATRYSKSIKLLMPVVLSLIIILSCGIYLYHDNVWFLALFVERTLFIPAQITYHYFEFFQNNPLMYLSDSILKYIFDSPYPLPVSLIIGIRYHDGASCNTGLLGNAYMNFGIPGVFLFLSILSFILSIFDRIATSKEANASLIMASVAMTLISILNSGLLTVMLTHGMFLALVLAFFIPSNRK